MICAKDSLESEPEKEKSGKRAVVGSGELLGELRGAATEQPPQGRWNKNWAAVAQPSAQPFVVAVRLLLKESVAGTCRTARLTASFFGSCSGVPFELRQSLNRRLTSLG